MLTQRLGSTTQLDDRFINDFIRIVKEHPGCCDEVWLATQYGFPPLEIHRKTAEKLAKTAEIFRSLGIRVSLQISNTIGHGQYMSSRDCSGLVYEGSPVRNIVGPDGTVSRYCFCWNDSVMRDYVLQEVKIYCEAIKPHTVWIDDDIRANNHNPVQLGCFCDDCIARYNRKYGTSFDRAGLVEAVNYGDPIYRKNFVEFLRGGLHDFAYAVYSAIHEVSPDTYAGLQNAANGSYTGYGLGHIYSAMLEATGKPPKSRPGGGAYSDSNPNSQIQKAYVIAFQNSMLPECVDEIRPEIENLPDVCFGKSNAGTCYETSLYFAAGATAMSYAMLMNDYEDMDWYGECYGMFAQHREYWKALSENNKRSRAAGMTIALGHEIWKRDITGEGEFAWNGEPYLHIVDSMRGTAIPMTYVNTNNPVYLLAGSGVYGLTDEEIEALLCKPVVASADAIEILCGRGYGDRFSAEVVPLSTAQLREDYNTEHPVNAHTKKLTLCSWSQSFYYTSGYAIRGNEEKVEPLGWYDTSALNAQPLFPENKEHPYGIADAIISTTSGAKWAVFGHTLWNNTISLARRDMILHAADYISGNALPAVLETGIKAELFPRENAEGKTISVSVINEGIGESGELRLRIRRPALAEGQKELRFMAQYRESRLIPFEYDGEDIIVKLPSLAPWSAGTVFIG